MNRKDLVDTLDLLWPAVAKADLIPQFKTFTFGDGEVYAHNDELTIIAPCEYKEKEPFAVNADHLYGILHNSRAEECDFEFDKDQEGTAIVKAGRTTAKLSFFSSDDLLWNEPEKEDWDLKTKLDERALMGVKVCLVTTSTDVTKPSLMGVVFNAGDGVSLYSCDSDALTHYILDHENKKDMQARYMLPTSFCEAVLKIAAKLDEKEVKLFADEDYVFAKIGEFRAYGRIISGGDELNHQEVIDKTLKGEPAYFPVPAGLNDALSRARALADAESTPTLLTVADGRLKLVTKTADGNVVRDSVKLKGEVPEVEARVSAALMQRALKTSDELAIQEKCTCYRLGKNLFQLLANIAE